jgi:sugar phosphate permease
LTTSAESISAATLARYRRLRIQTFALTWTAYASYYLCRKNLSVAKKALKDEHGLSNADLGTIDTGYLVAYAAGQFVSGVLGDRIGGKKLVGYGLILTGVLNVVFGFGAELMFFLAAWTANGIAQSSGWPGTTKAFSNWFARRERGTVMGLWCTCYQVGGVVATFLATFFLVRWGWRSAFFGPAALVLGFAALFWATQKASPEAEGLPDVERYYQVVGHDHAPDPDDHQRAGESRWTDNLLFVVKSRPIWTLGLSYVVMKFVRYSLLFWLPLYMAQALGYDAGEAGYTSGAFEIAGVVGAGAAGLASDRVFGGRRAPVVVVMMLLLALATYAYVPLSGMGRLPNLLGIGLVGFLLYGPDSVTSGAAAVDFGDRHAAALATGFVNGLGSIGGALSGVVVGRMSDLYGWEAVFRLFPPMCVAAAVLMATMWNRTPSTSHRRP